MRFNGTQGVVMRKSMENSCDRICELPNNILESFLSLLPLKYAIRSSILSKRWRNLWEISFSYATHLDFGKDFAKAQTQEQFVSTVNRYLHLHNINKIDGFRLYFHPGDKYKADLNEWIEFAILRGVKDLDLLLCTSSEHGDDKDEIRLPDIFFGCNSLISLRASHIEFNPTTEFGGFHSLVTLKLNQVNITDSDLEKILFTCPVLSHLYLRLCSKLESVKIAGPDLQLKSLSLIVTGAYEIDIFAPNLISVHFYGTILYGSFRNVAALEDVFINADGYELPEPELDFIQMLSAVSHIKILTMCLGAPMDVTLAEEDDPEFLPVYLLNLQELQILVGGQIGDEYLGYIFCFFQHTVLPCLSKLFIDLSGPYVPLMQPDTNEAEVPFICTFYNLQIVKISHFRGSHAEMKMVKFFLNTAIVLECLILVVAPDSLTDTVRNNEEGDSGASQSETRKKTIGILVDQMLHWPKASKDAQIMLFENSKFDTTVHPFHTHTDYCLENVCCDF